jgi:predicted phage terminase large subunit-like protein
MMLGPRDFASLFQGVPMPAEGNLVMRRWLRHAKRRPEAGDILATVQSWDTAQKAGELNDWSVCTTWAVTRTNAHLIDQLRERYEYPALERAFRLHADQHNPSLILVEDKGHGTALIQNLRGQYPIVAVEPLADKMTRLSTQSTAYETGRIIHPDPEVAEWIIPFETELTSAPDVEHDDRCDSVSQFLAWYNRGLQNFRFKSVSVPSENTDVPGATDSLDPSTGFGRLRSGLDTDGF